VSTSQLTLYNGALRILGQPKLSALTDAVENRRLLDGVWDENARDYCLEQGLWNFAIRTSQVEYDPSVTEPDFGFKRAFSKPSDWIRTSEIASDEYFTHPLTHLDYVDEQGYWWSDLETIWVRYVSNDTSYGYDYSLWPQSFVRYFEHYLALQIAPFIYQDPQRVDTLRKLTERVLIDARSKDALNEGIKFPPRGKWSRARRGYAYSDLGSRNRLTG